MANIALLIVGCVLAIIGIIILIVNSSNKSNFLSYIEGIKKNVRDCSYMKDLDKVIDGELIFINAVYNTIDSEDKDFNVKFKDNIIKRTVERYSASRRMLQNEEEIEDESSNALIKIENQSKGE